MNINQIENIQNPSELADAIIELEKEMGPFQFNNEKLHNQINRLWTMTRTCEKQDPVLSKALLAKIGGQIPMDLLEGSALKTFLVTNHLHHRMQATRMAVTHEGALPIVQDDGSTIWVPWSQLTEISLNNQRIFSYQGKLAFTTDLNYKLEKDYTYTHNGIRRYNIWTADQPISSLKEDPAKWDRKFVLEIRSDIHHSQGEYGAGGCSGQHTFMILRDPQGHSYAIGKYGPFDDIQCVDKVSPGGKKPGRISFVDEYMFFPPGFANSHSAKIELTADEYRDIFEAIRQTHAQPSRFSLIKENCNSFVVDFVKTHCKIKIKNTMPLRTYFFRLLPPSFLAFAYKIQEKTYDKLPSVVKKALAIIGWPVRYVLNVITSAFGFLLNLVNREGLKGQDITLLDVLKGSAEIHHPIAFRDSLKKMVDADGYLRKIAN